MVSKISKIFIVLSLVLMGGNATASAVDLDAIGVRYEGFDPHITYTPGARAALSVHVSTLPESTEIHVSVGDERIDANFQSFMKSLPSLAAFQMVRARPLSAKEAEILFHTLSPFPLHDLELSGGIVQVLRYDGYPNSGFKDKDVPLLDEVSFPAILRLLESLTLKELSFNVLHFNAKTYIFEAQFWASVAQYKDLEVLDLLNHISLHGAPRHCFFTSGVYKCPAVPHQVNELMSLREFRFSGKDVPIAHMLERENSSDLEVMHLCLTSAGYDSLPFGPVVLEDKLNLRELTLSGSRAVPEDFIDQLSEVPLTDLRVSGINIIILDKMRRNQHRSLTGDLLRGLAFCAMTETLEYLDLSLNQIGDEGLAHVIGALKNLKHLNISSGGPYPQGITHEGLKRIHKASPFLEHLDIRGNDLTFSEKFDVVERLLTSHPALTLHIFTEEELQDWIVRFVMFGDHDSPILDFTNLPEERRLGDAGARLMARFFAGNERLEDLRLQHLTPESTTPVLVALRDAPTFNALTFVGEHGKTICAQTAPGQNQDLGLFEPLNLLSLSLRGNALGARSRFAYGSTIVHLDLSSNKALGSYWTDSQSVWPTFSQEQWPSLRKLNLSHNGFVTRGSGQVGKRAENFRDWILSADHGIEELDLSYNHIGRDVSWFLKKGEEGCALRTLKIDHNYDGDANSLYGFLRITDHHLTSLELDFSLVRPSYGSGYPLSSIDHPLYGLTQNTTLKHLALHDAGLGASKAHFIKLGYKAPAQWRQFRLYGAQNIAAVKPFFKAVALSSLESLSLVTTDIGKDRTYQFNGFSARSQEVARLLKLYADALPSVKTIGLTWNRYMPKDFFGSKKIRMHVDEQDITQYEAWLAGIPADVASLISETIILHTPAEAP